jgi:collagen beta-1,O-galactosyltransferase
LHCSESSLNGININGTVVDFSICSNFWGGMQDYYYIRTEEYKEILEQKKEGCFPVPLIHSCVLMNVKKNIIPNYNRPNESVPEDDIIIFAVNAQDNNITMEICNDLEYGYVVSPLEDETHLYQDINRLHNLRVEIASKCLMRIFSELLA